MNSRPTRRAARKRSRGSAILEATLTLTTVLLTLVVLFETGTTILLYQGATERARHGARYAAVHPTETEAIRNVVLYGDPNGSGTPMFGMDPDNVDINLASLDNEASVASINITVQPYKLITAVLDTGVRPITLRVGIPVEAEL